MLNEIDKKNKADSFYITTTLPYINSEPHIGFAAEIIKADVIARYMQKQGSEVFFNTGTDEHGLKIYQKAQEMGLAIADYCDIYSAKFLPLKEKLNLSYNNFIRTTDEAHIKAAQAFWLKCLESGDIYKKKYELKYCVGCEMEKTDSELENGHCPYHPGKELELIAEENYFFRFSKYQDRLLKLYQDNPSFVLPSSRLKEITSFVSSGLKDFSISRQKDKMPHGIAVPGDDTQVMYVWFDALVNYISALGWPDNLENFDKFWPGLQVCGKDNLRPQAAMWPAMLMSAGITPAKQVLVFGFLTIGGAKISKSAGNSVDPIELVDMFGSDALRYYLLSEISTFSDGDYSLDKFKTRYNADLANGLGNLSSRLANLLEKNEIETNLKVDLSTEAAKTLQKEIAKAMEAYHFNEALQAIWRGIALANEELSRKTPWKLSDKTEIAEILIPLAQTVLNIAYFLEPYLPHTAKEIKEQFGSNKIKKGEALFPRLK